MSSSSSSSPVSTIEDVAYQEFPQQHQELVLSNTWWWAIHITLSVVAFSANLFFIVTVIYNRKRQNLQSFVTAVILTMAFLDIIDVLRVTPVLIEAVFLEQIFRHVFCSFGIFHELAISVFIISIAIAICIQAGRNKHTFNEIRHSSLAHKILIPVVLLLAAAAASPFFLLPYKEVSHTCTDPFRVLSVLKTNSPSFTIDLYSTLVTAFTYILPLLMLPLLVPIASLKTCVGKQCCASRFKQHIGEIIMVTVIAIVYLGTIVGVLLPRIDEKLELNAVKLDRAPFLWELGNNAARPIIYFLTNPAVWDGVSLLCYRRGKNQLVNQDDDDIKAPLSPVTTV